MVLHISAQNWRVTDVISFEWNVFNFYDSIVRWAVPVFVMISGALFLSREYSIKKIYGKNILRILVAFFWVIVLCFDRWSLSRRQHCKNSSTYIARTLSFMVFVYDCWIIYCYPIPENNLKV